MNELTPQLRQILARFPDEWGASPPGVGMHSIVELAEARLIEMRVGGDAFQYRRTWRGQKEARRR